jgi:hypothetical protein
MQMAREYQSAALIQKELSSDLRSGGAHHVGLQAERQLIPPTLLDHWDRLSHAYALVRRESPAEMMQEDSG